MMARRTYSGHRDRATSRALTVPRNLPAFYAGARRQLAEARRVDEVKDIRDKASAIAVYAFQAKDGQMAADAVEIKKRATRKLGALIAEYREAGRLAKGRLRRGVTETPRGSEATLAEQGIEKGLAKHARRFAAMPESEFERDVERTRRLALAAVDGDRQFIKEMRRERMQAKQKRRLELVRELAASTERASQILGRKQYNVIYADPPWRFKTWETGSNSMADDHYPTMELDAIKAIPIPAADDAVLFLWGTVPMMPQAFEVMAAWGFTYRSLSVWLKDRTGTGYWSFNRVELLLIGTRGKIPAPAPGTQPPQVIEAPRGRHSEKPKVFADIIEQLFPTVPKLEMFARAARPGWDVWGNEAEPPSTEAAE